MTVQQDFLPFATNAGANVLTQTAWNASTTRGTGFKAGLAQSAAFNKAWRQGSIMAAMLGEFIAAQTGQPVIDDGTTATILANFIAAVIAAAQSGGGGGGGGTTGNGYAIDTSTTINSMAATLSPAITGYTLGMTVRLLPANANTGPANLALNTLPPVSVVRPSGAQLSAGDLQNGTVYELFYNGETWQVIGSVTLPGVFVQDTSTTVGLITGATTPPLGAYFPGMRLAVIPATTNTGVTTIDVNNAGAINIVRPNGAALAPGDLIAGVMCELLYTGTVFQLVAISTGGVTWSNPIVTGNINATVGMGYFVNTTGNPITITMPATAAQGASVSFVDVAGMFGTNNLTLANNSNNIMGLAQDMTFSRSYAAGTLGWSGNATFGWRITHRT
jgi:hypothetical protein